MGAGATGLREPLAWGLAERVRRARAWSAAPGVTGDEGAATVGWWLQHTVVRPLVAAGVIDTEASATVAPQASQAASDGAAGASGPGAGADALGGLVEAVLAVAEALVAACGTDPGPELLEACAGALRVLTDHLLPDTQGDGEAGGPGRAHRLAALWRRAAAVPAGPAGRVIVAVDGPYLAVGPAASGLVSWLGEPITAPPVVALCRCGASAAKPWCDGSHAEIGFSGAKRGDRVPDRLEVYPGRQFTISDNRGLCAHSGRCTDTLPTAFRAGAEPFVAPAGARADDIARAVQVCPSGALGAALEGRRAAELADTARPPGIEVSKDGPYRLTGGIEVLGPDGAPVERSAGASPEHCSLCRCGQSSNKPFCSGAHWYAEFHDPVPDPGTEPSLFVWAGGYPALLRMTRLFYERHVPDDELLAPLFAGMEPDHPERVAAWLGEVFGGPELYSRRYGGAQGGYARMISQHVGKHLSEAQRARWVALLARSADEAGLPADAEFRAAFTAYLEWGSRIAVENSAEGAAPPAAMPVPKWWWVCNAAPATRPSSSPSAVAEPAPEVETPAPDEPVSYARHIAGLFRARDRASMRFAFDLWSHAEVSSHAEAILARLHDGSMPCDGAWPGGRVAVFARWVALGCPP